jgi:hypothetical protein
MTAIPVVGRMRGCSRNKHNILERFCEFLTAAFVAGDFFTLTTVGKMALTIAHQRKNSKLSKGPYLDLKLSTSVKILEFYLMTHST